MPCEGETKPLNKEEVLKYVTLIKSSWDVSLDNKAISMKFKFKDFKEAMMFINKVAYVAEEQGHHPDISVSYNKVDISLTTHAIKGLSVNDFIIASKIDHLLD